MSNERYVEKLAEIFNSQEWDPEAMLAFGAAVRALIHDDEFLAASEELERFRERLTQQAKSSSEYARMVGELEELQNRVYALLQGPSGAVDPAVIAKLKGAK